LDEDAVGEAGVVLGVCTVFTAVGLAPACCCGMAAEIAIANTTPAKIVPDKIWERLGKDLTSSRISNLRGFLAVERCASRRKRDSLECGDGAFAFGV
jgi:hypothetical protein